MTCGLKLLFAAIMYLKLSAKNPYTCNVYIKLAEKMVLSIDFGAPHVKLY